jgi:hypothetical protein
VGIPGQQQCNNCTAGYSTMVYTQVGGLVGKDLTVCTACMVGRIQALPAQPECTQCTAGKYADNVSMVQCLDCAAGQFSAATGHPGPCTPCVAGQSQDQTGATACTDCGEGTYTDATGLLQCLECAPGRWLAGTAQAGPCTDCEAGKTSSEAASSSEDDCTNCRRGTYALNEGTSFANDGLAGCTECPPGRHTLQTGSTSVADCEACGFGRYRASVHATYPTPGTPENYDVASLAYVEGDDAPNTPEPDKKGPCMKCPDGKGHAVVGAEGLDNCTGCAIGKYGTMDAIPPDQWDEGYIGHTPDPNVQNPTIIAPVPDGSTCRNCPPGKHTIDYNNSICQACGQDLGKQADFNCAGGYCQRGHLDARGALCAPCMTAEQGRQKCRKAAEAKDAGQVFGADESTAACPYGDADELAKDIELTKAFFAANGKCEECGDNTFTIILVCTAFVIATFGMTYAIVKGISNDDVERVKGSMDMAKSMSAIFGQLQRMTAVMSMPFGWPAWLVNVCFWLKQLVAFDFPGLAAPECAAEMSPAELVFVRVGVTAVILPVVWFVVLVQMVIVAKCTKMGRRKVRRGVSLFGLNLLNKCTPMCKDRPEGAWQMMVITMHQLFFLGVVTKAFSVLNCVDVPTGNVVDGEEEVMPALSLDPLVFCETDEDLYPDQSRIPPNDLNVNDAQTYFNTRALGIAMIVVYGGIISFVHWDVQVEFVGVFNKGIVAAVTIFLGCVRSCICHDMPPVEWRLV